MSRQTLSRADTLVTAKLAESHHLSFILAEDLDLVSHQSLTRKVTCMDSEKEKKHAFSFSFSQYCIRIDQLYWNGVAEQVCSVLPRPQSTSLILLLQVSEATVDRTRHLSDIWELWRVIQKLTASPAASWFCLFKQNSVFLSSAQSSVSFGSLSRLRVSIQERGWKHWKTVENKNV